MGKSSSTFSSPIYRAGSLDPPFDCNSNGVTIGCFKIENEVHYARLVFRCNNERDHFPCNELWADRRAGMALTRLNYAKALYKDKHDYRHFEVSFKSDQGLEPTEALVDNLYQNVWAVLKRLNGSHGKHNHKVPSSLVWSDADLDLVQTIKDNIRMSLKTELCEECSWEEKTNLGALVVVHGWRHHTTDEGQVIWTPGLHAHIILMGRVDIPPNGFPGGDLVVVNLDARLKAKGEVRKSLFGTISYLLNHSVVIPHRPAMRWFGRLGYNQIPKDEEPEYTPKPFACHECGAPKEFIRRLDSLFGHHVTEDAMILHAAFRSGLLPEVNWLLMRRPWSYERR